MSPDRHSRNAGKAAKKHAKPDRDRLKALLTAERPKQTLVQFLRSTALGEIEVRRQPDRGREPAPCSARPVKRRR